MLSTMLVPEHLPLLLSEQLEGEVHDLAPLLTGAAHRMYSALWNQHEGSLPIIIRFFPGSRGAEEAKVEANALRELFRAGYPVPECYLLIEDDHTAGAPFIVIQYLPGEPLGAVAIAQPERVNYWLDKASALLLRLHGLRWQDSFDPFQPALAPLDFAERQLKLLVARARTASADDALAGLGWLRANIHYARRARRTSLIHRDFHPDNLLVKDNAIISVLDWGELTIADPAVDVGWSRMVLATEVDPRLGDTFAEAYKRRSPEVGETLDFWEVFAACKRLTALALHRSTGGAVPLAGNTPPVKPEVVEAVRTFMYQRLTDEE
jgi:aminoglycoside phosphotransferase (APT) family kinase protein